MKIQSLIITSLLFASPILAKETNLIDYVGIGIASQNIENKAFDKGTSLVLNAGKNSLYKDLGLEVEGTLQLNKPTATINSSTSDLKFWTMGMYGTYLWKIDSITIKPRLGLVYESIKSSFNTENTNILQPTDKKKVGVSAGLGISYKLTNNSQLFTNYTKFEDDIEHLTFGAEFKF